MQQTDLTATPNSRNIPTHSIPFSLLITCYHLHEPNLVALNCRGEPAKSSTWYRLLCWLLSRFCVRDISASCGLTRGPASRRSMERIRHHHGSSRRTRATCLGAATSTRNWWFIAKARLLGRRVHPSELSLAAAVVDAAEPRLPPCSDKDPLARGSGPKQQPT